MLYIMVILGIFIFDGVIKFLIETMAVETERIPVFGGRAYLTKCHNKGAFLNLGETRRELIKGVSFVLTGVCLLIFVFTLGKHGKHLLKTGMACLLGGAFSNTYDRMFRKYVVDYLGFSVENKKLSNIIFNISDFFIMLGAALISCSSIITQSNRHKNKSM